MRTFKIFLLISIFTIITYSQNFSPNLNWSMHLISDLETGYDYQSHGSAQQVWLDLNNPGYLHAVFIYSAVADNAWADRTSLYFGSIDGGESWFEVGAVPVNNGTSGRSGYPSIVGTSDGRAVISNHNNKAPHPGRSTIFIDNSSFENNFTEYDPGETTTGQPLYPKLAVLPNNDVLLAAFSSDLYLNKLSGGIFNGWALAGGGVPETYSLAVSETGSKLGLACLGESLSGQANWVFYNETTDGGITWATPTIVWQAYTDSVSGNILGCFRGVNLTFNGEEPCVVFEVGWNTNTGGYFPELPSQIRFWSPNINQGSSIIIADSNNFPFYRNYGIYDSQYPLSRPVIGRAQVDDYLFVAFNATTGDYWPGTSSADSTAYYCGMFMYSSDVGNTWSIPERFTPITSPLLDWRYVSIVPVSPVNNNNIQVHLVMQGDPMPGSTLNGWSLMPPSISAQYYHFSNELLIIDDVEEEQNVISSFNLEQNYPNPFNPSTKIKFVIPDGIASEAKQSQMVSLKVYDILGNEIATLVNEELSPGEFEVEFGGHSDEGQNLPSGVYFYQLRIEGPETSLPDGKAGSGQGMIQTKKMILMK
jgi:hypothetical protein